MSGDPFSYSEFSFDELGNGLGHSTGIPSITTSLSNGAAASLSVSSSTPSSPLAGRGSPDLFLLGSRPSRHGSGAYRMADRTSDARISQRTPTPLSSISDSRDQLEYQIIALADEDSLSRSRNAAYLARVQQIDRLKTDNTSLRVQLAMYKKLYDDLLAKFPQLIGMNDAAVTAETSSTTRSAPSKLAGGVAPWAHLRVTLGLGLELPTPPPFPPGARFKFWHKSAFMNKKKSNVPRQYNSDEINVAQLFAEDESGQPVSGAVAREMRYTVGRLLHSLQWSGQFALTYSELTDEAYVYLHATLARRFPLLLFCEGGRWKIDQLISQVYSGFKANHKSKSSELLVKAENVPVNLSDSHPSTSKTVKRERSPSATSTTIHPRKKAALDISLTSPTSQVLSSSHPAEQQVESTEVLLPSSPAATPVQTEEPTQSTADLCISAPSAAAPPASSAASQAVPIAEDTSRHVAPSDPETSADNSARIASDVLTPAQDKTANNRIVPVAKRFTITVRPPYHPGATLDSHPVQGTVNTSSDPEAALTGLPEASQRTPASSPSTNINTPAHPDISPSDGLNTDAVLPGPVSTVAPIAGASNVGDSASSESTPAFSAATLSTAPKSRGGNKAAYLKAVTKYNPEVISDKNLHMKQMIDANPNVTVAECNKAFAALTVRDIENLKAETSALRRTRTTQRKAAQNTLAN